MGINVELPDTFDGGMCDFGHYLSTTVPDVPVEDTIVHSSVEGEEPVN